MANEEIQVVFGGNLGPLSSAFRSMKSMADKAGESIKDSFKDAFKHLTAPLSIAGAFEAIHSLMEDVKNIKRISESTGLDTGVTQDLLNLGKASGVASDAIESMLDKLVKGLAPGSDPEDALFRIADKMASISDPAERARLAVENFGKSGAKLIPILMQGSEGVKKMAEEWGKMSEAQIELVEHTNQTLEKTGSAGKVKLAQWFEGLSMVVEKYKELNKQNRYNPFNIVKAFFNAENDPGVDGPDTATSKALPTPAEQNKAKVDAGVAAAKKISDEEEYLFAKPQEKVLTLTRKILELRRQIEDATDPDEQVKLGEKMVDLEEKRKSITDEIASKAKSEAEKRKQIAKEEKEIQHQILEENIKMADLKSTGALNRQYGTLQEVANSGYSAFRHNQWEFQQGPLAAQAQQAQFLDARAHRERLFGDKSDAERDEGLSQKLKEGLEASGAIAPTITDHLKSIRESSAKMQENIQSLTDKLAELKKSQD